MGLLKWFQFLLFPLVYAAIFISFLYPEFNPDLFWHLASARAAEEEGRLFMNREIFSFTLNGAPWLNFEWLFQWLMWKMYKLGGFRLLVFWRAFMVVGIIAALDVYAAKWLRPSKILRLANIVFAFLFISTRASAQPELFTLLFLVLFFFLRDAFLEGKRNFMLFAAWIALFAVWANIHGGYVLGLGIMGLQFIARVLEWANAVYKTKKRIPVNLENLLRWRQEAAVLVFLGFSAFFATWLNPYGVKVYSVIFEHLQDSSAISQLIDEWQPSQLYSQESWPYFILLLVLAVNMAGSLMARKIPFEAVLILLVFARFASSHVRHVAVFGASCLPIFWKPFYLDAAQAWLKRFNRAAVAIALIFGLGFLATVSAREAVKIKRMGIPSTHVKGDKYPHRAFYFMEANPHLIRLPSLVEWGWAGYAQFRLYDKGLRTFFDGRYLFHHLLRENMETAGRPEKWRDYADQKGIDLCLLKYPKDPYDFHLMRQRAPTGLYEDIPRSWHSQAMDKNIWALVWWDHVSLLFVRRKVVDPKWLAAHEYKSPIPYDPYWVERQVKYGKIKIDDLVKEVYRNVSETQINKVNSALLVALSSWEEQMNKKGLVRRGGDGQ